MKPRGKPIYSVNEGNACLFDDAVTKYLESIKFPKVSTSVFCFCLFVFFSRASIVLCLSLRSTNLNYFALSTPTKSRQQKYSRLQDGYSSRAQREKKKVFGSDCIR